MNKKKPQVKILTANSKPLRQRPSDMPVQQEMCPTCPYRKDSPYEYLRRDLDRSALCEASRVCHSTGSHNGVYHRTGKPPALCRGARNTQLLYFAAIGFIEKPTDEAWNKKLKEIQDEDNHEKKKTKHGTH